MKYGTKKPGDIALEAVEKQMFSNPEALKQLNKLEMLFTRIERAEDNLKQAKKAFSDEAKVMSNILDLLMVNEYRLPGRNFKVKERTYRQVKIVDARAFMLWLKESGEPTDVIELLTPPTYMSDVKKYVEKKLQDTQEFELEIPGIITKATYTILKGYRHDRKEKNQYKKTSKEQDGYRRERGHQWKRADSKKQK